jgi:hypothetical protein
MDRDQADAAEKPHGDHRFRGGVAGQAATRSWASRWIFRAAATFLLSPPRRFDERNFELEFRQQKTLENEAFSRACCLIAGTGFEPSVTSKAFSGET